MRHLKSMSKHGKIANTVASRPIEHLTHGTWPLLASHILTCTPNLTATAMHTPTAKWSKTASRRVLDVRKCHIKWLHCPISGWLPTHETSSFPLSLIPHSLLFQHMVRVPKASSQSPIQIPHHCSGPKNQQLPSRPLQTPSNHLLASKLALTTPSNPHGSQNDLYNVTIRLHHSPAPMSSLYPMEKPQLLAVTWKALHDQALLRTPLPNQGPLHYLVPLSGTFQST